MRVNTGVCLKGNFPVDLKTNNQICYTNTDRGVALQFFTNEFFDSLTKCLSNGQLQFFYKDYFPHPTSNLSLPLSLK
jgi:hypothetical protein